MNALPHSVPAPRKPQSARNRRQRAKAVRRNRAAYRGKALETMTLLSINTFLIVIGAYTLVQLLPYQLSQHAKLQTLQQEATEAEQRLQALQAEYQQNLTPAQTQKIAEEQGYLVGEKKLTITWQD